MFAATSVIAWTSAFGHSAIFTATMVILGLATEAVNGSDPPTKAL